MVSKKLQTKHARAEQRAKQTKDQITELEDQESLIGDAFRMIQGVIEIFNDFNGSEATDGIKVDERLINGLELINDNFDPNSDPNFLQLIHNRIDELEGNASKYEIEASDLLDTWTMIEQDEIDQQYGEGGYSDYE